MWSEKSPGNCHFVKRKMTKVTNFREPENKEVEKLNRTNLPFSSQIPFKVICPESLNSPLKRKRGNPCPRLLLTKNRCFLTEVKVRRKVSVLELAAHGSNLITQVPWGLFFNIKHTSLCLITISWAIMSKIKSTHSTQIQTHIHETHSHTCARTQTHSYWDISQLVATCHVTLRESLPPLSFTSFCFIPFHFPLPSASFKRMRGSIQNICFHHW